MTPRREPRPSPTAAPPPVTILRQCLSLDLEIAVKDGALRALAACRPDTGQQLSLSAPQAGRPGGLAQLDDMTQGALFILGHNIIAFDLPHLAALDLGLNLLKLPAVDTLRLNPLAFPRNPYHHLVKHYQDGGLVRGRINNPLLDAQLAFDLFQDQQQALAGSDSDLLTAWHWLTSLDDAAGFNLLFEELRKSPKPSGEEAGGAIRRRLTGQACTGQAEGILANAHQQGWPLAYALAWLSVAGSNSTMPPWVLYEFPRAGEILKLLRDTPCQHGDCQWCRERHDPQKELTRWFGFPDFRPEPADEDGIPLQKTIVQRAMAGEHLLAILPTGAGKSVCYQVPALSRYDKTGAVTVVISPLVALMSDQVANLEQRGISSCVTVNGLLSMPERAEALARLRLGDAAILLISPEQLRSKSVRNALAQRSIGAWVLDEAHCLSKWGHDFRPDYRYIGRFIREQTGDAPPPPILCLTATAKPDVKQEIVEYFQEILGIEMQVLDGGTQRTNLNFVVIRTATAQKLDHISRILEADLPTDQPGGAIIYCATRRHAEQVADFLKAKDIAADHFHAGLTPERKKHVQQSFIQGGLRAIAATNAFGMGIDKPDVRLVIHADIPGSLENYLQEAGRAGRDSGDARCILLYTDEDIERQFGMSARSRLTQAEISAVLKALRNLDRRERLNGEVVATAGEILLLDEEHDFQRDSQTDDNRVRTAVGWLEEAVLLSRHANEVNVFPSSLMVTSLQQAETSLNHRKIDSAYRRQLLNITRRLMNAAPDAGISTDELMAHTGLDRPGIRSALHDLAQMGIVSNDTVLTAFVHQGVQRGSSSRFNEAARMEEDLIRLMQEQAPDQQKGETLSLHLRQTTQALKDQGHRHALPQLVQRSLRSIAADDREDTQGTGSLRLRTLRNETVQVTLMQEWRALQRTAEIRRQAAGTVLQHLLSSLPQGARGADLLVETTMGQLTGALNAQPMLGAGIRNIEKLLHQALLWLHDQDVIRLNKGLTILRPAMTIRLEAGRRRFQKSDYTPLQMHYDEQVLQIHIMTEYAHQGLNSMAAALHLALDYFNMSRDGFLDKWLASRRQELQRQTTPESWRRIVESLNNPVQRRIVADDRESTNVLVLAGPGSGKTRVLVHRIAYLIRVRRENPGSILALAYNRHAAVQIRQRLHDLIGDDAHGVTILTCHAMAMRLVGASFAGSMNNTDQQYFDQVLIEATALLNGGNAAPEDADEQRDRLLAGFRWILVDEYQDIKGHEYELISALAGRTRDEDDQKLTIFAVGDDDQNIYAFSGSSTEYIKRFEEDYRSRPAYLTDNYRSTGHIITAANAVIEPAGRRMKAGQAIAVNRARARDNPGGPWAASDPVTQGRVQILPAGGSPITQAQAAIRELQRLSGLSRQWDWASCAVIARTWDLLDPVRSLCQLEDIPVQVSREDFSGTWQLRETQALLQWLDNRPSQLISAEQMLQWLQLQKTGPWNGLLAEAVENYGLETGNAALPIIGFREWLAEWARDNRRRQHGLLLTSVHRAKGLEFDHVAVLDGGWENTSRQEDGDAPRRLYYVAMTRARQTLTLMKTGANNPFLDALANNPSVLVRPQPGGLPPAPPEMERSYHRLSLRDVQLSFPGYRHPRHPIHQAIARLSPGDPLQVRTDKTPWELVDARGTTVGRLSRSYETPGNPGGVSATVLAIGAWDKTKSDSEYQNRLNADRWEVIIPELAVHP